jgi:putative NADH-flavin reductase
MQGIRTRKPMAAAFGATGYTGRFVVAELLRRNITPIAIARDAVALEAARFSGLEVFRRRHATVDDEGSLDRAIDGAEVVVNCAGPFIDTADALALPPCELTSTISMSVPSRLLLAALSQNTVSLRARPVSPSCLRWPSTVVSPI